MAKLPRFLRVLSFLVIGAFFSATALSLFLGMTMRMDGFISPCPLMDGDGALCPITLAKHLAGWQELSTAQPLRGILGVVFLVLVLQWGHLVARSLFLFRVSFHRIRKRFFALRRFTSLSTAFSKGIIHARLFA